MTETKTIAVNDVRYVPELYPRLKPSDEIIGRYQDALENLPPISVAREGVLVDGYHRWQAHLRSNAEQIEVDNLGNLTDAEILNESIRRNRAHGYQLSRDDKKALAGKLWPSLGHLKPSDRIEHLRQMFSVSRDAVEKWTSNARQTEREQQREQAWDMWLNCYTEREIAEQILGDRDKQKTINNWLSKIPQEREITQPPDPHMAFDVWSYGKYDGDNSRFGKLVPGVVENLLWLFTEPGQIVFDPFVGAGTTIDVAKRMGRRVWASDAFSASQYPNLPIHTHDITTGWPEDAPRKVDLAFLDPPYWRQAKGRYSDSFDDLGNVTLEDFNAAWAQVVKTCADRLSDGGRLAFIVSPSECEDGTVVDHAFDMYAACVAAGLHPERRIIVPYNTQQATGQQVTWARENRRLLKLYRDLVVFTR